MPRKIVVINPNCTSSMTRSLEHMLSACDLSQKYNLICINPSNGIASINNEDDANQSLEPCQTLLVNGGFLTSHDGFLVACYSSHPLVGWLRSQLEVAGKPVLGIFEASVFASLNYTRRDSMFGIVSTGKVWKQLLTEGVKRIASEKGKDDIGRRFAGVETTGLSATEFHDMPADEVDEKMKAAVKRLVKKGEIGAICLGCAGMTGMYKTVREALVEELGEKGENVRIVDGVLEGVRLLGASLEV